MPQCLLNAQPMPNYGPIAYSIGSPTFAGALTHKKTMAGEEGLEPSHAGIKIQCLNQLGDSPTRVGSTKLPTDKPSNH